MESRDSDTFGEKTTESLWRDGDTRQRNILATQCTHWILQSGARVDRRGPRRRGNICKVNIHHSQSGRLIGWLLFRGTRRDGHQRQGGREPRRRSFQSDPLAGEYFNSKVARARARPPVRIHQDQLKINRRTCGFV